ncbi:MAG: RagB/SusD family nutrient uptake outer membrane protein [Pedobacter sp.]|uniref:RagB/SusD family nutrient uptake outer membrane protein n=1 Tax=Pedobacter sp. TaxID=1411316 RepID=UPI0028089839|nr:RagB/SusD family nutrient uptake outer membrane protein [Pedobacter sp.]MDQ8004766.1 RagB/SusD family nutrient uptake outer membrane protein [Pedobacter sp.]
MKRFIYISLLVSISTFSCQKDFLQRDTGVPISQEDVFKNPLFASRFADNTYNFLINDYCRLAGSPNVFMGTTGEFTDEAVFSGGDPSVVTMNKGNYLNPSATDVVVPYTQMYQGIRNANTMLANIDIVPWTMEQNPALIRAQMLFLRAMFYFELIKRYGGVVLLDKPLALTDETDLPRSTYEETLAFILNDIRAAETLLATEHFNTIYTPGNDWNAGNFGRITQGACKALRSRLLLLDASPLRNPSNDLSKWTAAANAAKEIIDMGRYDLQASYSTLLFVPTSPEYILITVRPPRPLTNAADHIMSPGSGGVSGKLNPTQNHVDLYEMNNGKPITDPTSGYNPATPYLNRDPRFYANILYNDAPWQGRRMEMFEDGRDYRGSAVTYTRTRYYTRKLWPEALRAGSTATALLNFIQFRYGEVLLNYAEALNEAQGPIDDVYFYINKIRTRAGMPNLPAGLSKDEMRARIHNERAVELAFEEHRWWDVLRWKKGKEINEVPVEGMNVVKTGTTFTYNRVTLDQLYQRVFVDRMYVYPIPQAEIIKSRGALVQTPGW